MYTPTSSSSAVIFRQDVQDINLQLPFPTPRHHHHVTKSTLRSIEHWSDNKRQLEYHVTYQDECEDEGDQKWI